MSQIWLGLDLGNARVGVAISNPERSFAYPAGNIKVQGDYFQAFDDVLNLIEDQQLEHNTVTCIAIGLPLQMDGSVGASAKKAQRWGRSLARRLEAEIADPVSQISSMPDIIFIDERLTTVDAHRRLFDANVNSKAHRAVVDQQSAVEILQAALDRAHRTTEEF